MLEISDAEKNLLQIEHLNGKLNLSGGEGPFGSMAAILKNWLTKLHDAGYEAKNINVVQSSAAPNTGEMVFVTITIFYYLEPLSRLEDTKESATTVKAVTESYAEHVISGSNEYTSVKVSWRDPHSITRINGSFGFRFYDLIKATTNEDIELVSQRQNISGWYYPGAQLVTLDQLHRGSTPREMEVIYQTPSEHPGSQTIITMYGETWPFYPGDTLLDS